MSEQQLELFNPTAGFFQKEALPLPSETRSNPYNEIAIDEDTEQAIIDLALETLRLRMKEVNHFFTNPEDTRSYLRLKLSEKEREEFWVLFLNNQHGLIHEECLSFGTIDAATIHPREVVKAALRCNAAATVLVHNHPSGKSEPSGSDKRITERLVKGLSMVDVRVLDHLVVGSTDISSFAELGLMP